MPLFGLDAPDRGCDVVGVVILSVIATYDAAVPFAVAGFERQYVGKDLFCVAGGDDGLVVALGLLVVVSLLVDLGGSQGLLEAGVLGIQGLLGEDDLDDGDLALNLLAGLALLDSLVLVGDGLGVDLGGLVQAGDAALEVLDNIDDVVDSVAHTAQDEGVGLGLAVSTVQGVDGVLDVHLLAAGSDDADLVLLGGGLGGTLGLDTAELGHS